MKLLKRTSLLIAVLMVMLMASITILAQGGGSQVRFVHAIPDAPAVDVYANGQLVVGDFAFGEATTYVSAPVGIHTITVTAANSISPLWEQQVTIGEDTALTMIASSQDTLGFVAFEDDLAALAEGNARFLLIHGIANGPAVDIITADGSPIAQNMGYGQSVGTFDVPAGIYEILVVPAGGTPADALLPSLSLEFVAGTSNIALVYGSPTAPDAMLLTAATNDSGAEVELADNVVAGADITESVLEAPSLSESEVVQSTPEPAQPEVSEPVVVVSDEEGPVTARVLLDPGANIQLRQYPNNDAFSLGLAPSGTIFEVIGREGAPAALVEGEPDPPEAEDWIDPAEDLAEDEDLVPEETWLNVLYTTPDGGQIIAWVNAQYLDVRDGEGGIQRLADLDTVPGNFPGEAVATEITPPVEAEDRVVGVIYNLDPGINLNIRRTPETAGEVLARIPNGTVVEFVGVIDDGGDIEDADWVFVQYLPPEGGSVSGWVSALYIRFEWNGERTDFEELEDYELLPDRVDPDRRGEVRGDIEPISRPTPDPLEDTVVAEVVLDSGANLHLRRDPDSGAESLVLIPSGARLVVSDISSDRAWLQVTYEGTTGWIASSFVVLSYNGEFVETSEISFTATGEAIITEGAAPATIPLATPVVPEETKEPDSTEIDLEGLSSEGQG